MQASGGPEQAPMGTQLIDDSFLPSIELLLTRAEAATQRILAHHLRDPGRDGEVTPCFPIEDITRRLVSMPADAWAYSCLDDDDCEAMTNVPLEILVRSVGLEDHDAMVTMVDILYRRFLDLVIMSSAAEPVSRPENDRGRVSTLLERTIAPSLRKIVGLRSLGWLQSQTEDNPKLDRRKSHASNRHRALARLMKIDRLRRQMRPRSIVIFGHHDRLVASAVRSEVERRRSGSRPFLPTPGLANDLGVHESVIAVVWYSVVRGCYSADEQARHCAWAESTRRLIGEIMDEDLLDACDELGYGHLRSTKGAHTVVG